MMHDPGRLTWRERLPVRRRTTYAAEATIITGADDPAERTALLVLSGTVRLSHVTADGSEQVMIYLPPGSLFGEQAALGRTRVNANLVAIADERCDIGHVYADDLAAVLQQGPEPLAALMRITSEKTSLFVEAVARAGLGAARARIGSVLGALRRRHDEIEITHERLARLCATTRPTVAAELHRLHEQGAIRVQRNRILFPHGLG